MNTENSSMNALRLASIITVINVLVATGYAIAGLVSPASILPAGEAPTEAATIFAMYAAARTIPLAVVALVAIYRRSALALLVIGGLACLVQLVDAAVGLYQHDVGKTVGPLVIGVLQLYAVWNLHRATRTA
jgi:hypothetical protein